MHMSRATVRAGECLRRSVEEPFEFCPFCWSGVLGNDLNLTISNGEFLAEDYRRCRGATVVPDEPPSPLMYRHNAPHMSFLYELRAFLRLSIHSAFLCQNIPKRASFRSFVNRLSLPVCSRVHSRLVSIPHAIHRHPADSRRTGIYAMVSDHTLQHNPRVPMTCASGL